MAIPGESMSTTPIEGNWISPADMSPGTCGYEDYELGGIALNDASAGLQYQGWFFRLVGDDIYIGPIGGTGVLYLTIADISDITGAFDANMNPIIAYRKDGQSHVRYFDPGLPGFTTLSFNGTFPRLTLDDKRPRQSLSRDVLLFYLVGTSMYYRQQRDNYGTERFLMVTPPGTQRIGRVGMADTNRVQIEFLR